MRHMKTKRMMDYWLTLLANANEDSIQGPNKTWPDRSDIQPAACPDILGDMFILDIKGSDNQYRLAGTRLCAMHGRELKNEGFADGYAEQDQRTAENWVFGLSTDDYAVLICADATNTHGKILPLETLLLPLNHHGSRGHRVLGITVPLEEAFWLGSVGILKQTIRSVRMLRPWETAGWESTNLRADYANVAAERRSVLGAPSLSPHAIPSFASESLLDPALEPTSVPYLRVLEGGKQN